MPHAIESTAQLTAALLADTAAVAPLLLRLGYSTAICRFVNGLLDPAQQSQFALPMHLLARNLHLPASFVELRHAATHEALPSLAVLRTVAVRALDWLWTDYWAAVGVEADASGVAEAEVLLARARAALRAWRRLRRENPLREIKAGDASPEAKETAAVIKECADVALGGDESSQAIITALLEEKALVPAGKKKSRMMKGARLLWTPLLVKVEEAAPGFVARLLEAMGEVLRGAEELSVSLLREAREARPAAVLLADQEERDAEFTEAVFAWTSYLVGEKQTRSGKVSAGVDVEEVVNSFTLWRGICVAMRWSSASVLTL